MCCVLIVWLIVFLPLPTYLEPGTSGMAFVDELIHSSKELTVALVDKRAKPGETLSIGLIGFFLVAVRFAK